MKVVGLPGDGIGPEVFDEGIRVLAAVRPEIEVEIHPFGAEPMREHGAALLPETMVAAKRAEAVLMGAVGASDYSWTLQGASPEDALFGIRKELDTFANLRPISHGAVDFLIVRELVGGIYFGDRGVEEDGTVFDTCSYHPDEVRRVARKAMTIAGDRRGRVTSVDKANVMATSRMWREVVNEVAADFKSVEVDHLLADTAALRIVDSPEQFDVILTDNLFGDLLSDVAAPHGGGIGLLPSASLSSGRLGIYEPVHGSAPDIAGHGVANPTAMIRSVALMLRWSFGDDAGATAIERAVDRALEEAPTTDLGGDTRTRAFGDLVIGHLAKEGQTGCRDGSVQMAERRRTS